MPIHYRTIVKNWQEDEKEMITKELDYLRDIRNRLLLDVAKEQDNEYKRGYQEGILDLANELDKIRKRKG